MRKLQITRCYKAEQIFLIFGVIIFLFLLIDSAWAEGLQLHDEIGALRNRAGDRVPAGAICTQQFWTVKNDITTVLLGGLCIAGVPDGHGDVRPAYGIGIGKIPAIGLGVAVFYDSETKTPYLGVAGSLSGFINTLSSLRIPRPLEYPSDRPVGE